VKIHTSLQAVIPVQWCSNDNRVSAILKGVCFAHTEVTILMKISGMCCSFGSRSSIASSSLRTDYWANRVAKWQTMIRLNINSELGSIDSQKAYTDWTRGDSSSHSKNLLTNSWRSALGRRSVSPSPVCLARTEDKTGCLPLESCDTSAPLTSIGGTRDAALGPQGVSPETAQPCYGTCCLKVNSLR
jgi:hypothetical protein